MWIALFTEVVVTNVVLTGRYRDTESLHSRLLPLKPASRCC